MRIWSDSFKPRGPIPAEFAMGQGDGFARKLIVCLIRQYSVTKLLTHSTFSSTFENALRTTS